MELKLKRTTRTAFSTIGQLFVDGKAECVTLEDVDRGLSNTMALETIKAKKVFGKTAIPSGRYEITATYSEHFKKTLPLLLNVPGYDGVRIHPGNKPEDTEGCLLVGTVAMKDFVANSVIAFNLLFPKILAALKKGQVFITIE